MASTKDVTTELVIAWIAPCSKVQANTSLCVPPAVKLLVGAYRRLTALLWRILKLLVWCMVGLVLGEHVSLPRSPRSYVKGALAPTHPTFQTAFGFLFFDFLIRISLSSSIGRPKADIKCGGVSGGAGAAPRKSRWV